MEINITLFLQVINFLISYWFLNKFLFKPVFNFIRQKNLKEKRVVAIIDGKEQLLLGLEELKHENLIDFKKDLIERYRFVWKEEFSVPSEVKCDIEKSEFKSSIKRMKFLLLKKVPHVD